MPTTSHNRRELALTLAVQLCREGHWRDVHHRADAATRVADRLLIWLGAGDHGDDPSPAAPAARVAA